MVVSHSPFTAAATLLVSVGLLMPLVFAAVSPACPAKAPSALPRNKYYWPYAKNSIWNLPLGAKAVYKPANIPAPTRRAATADIEYMFIDPKAPLTKVYNNNDGWNHGTTGDRCAIQGGVIATVPMPAGYVVTGITQNARPNSCAVFVREDGNSVVQGQPLARCTATGPVTSMWMKNYTGLDADGMYGSHGGSALSAIGGSLRAGELTPSSGPIRHVLKINLWQNVSFYNSPSFRWPAKKADCGTTGPCADYGGSTVGMTMGSLLALRPSFNISSLLTTPAKMLAQALKDYGAYVVDSTAGSFYGFPAEEAPGRSFLDCFNASWGFPFDVRDLNHSFSKDIIRVVTSLHFIDNWNATIAATVMDSNGLLGAGGGAPRVAWAPEIGATVTPAPTTATPKPTTTTAPPTTTATTTTTPTSTCANATRITVETKDTAATFGTIVWEKAAGLFSLSEYSGIVASRSLAGHIWAGSDQGAQMTLVNPFTVETRANYTRKLTNDGTRLSAGQIKLFDLKLSHAPGFTAPAVPAASRPIEDLAFGPNPLGGGNAVWAVSAGNEVSQANKMTAVFPDAGSWTSSSLPATYYPLKFVDAAGIAITVNVESAAVVPKVTGNPFSDEGALYMLDRGGNHRIYKASIKPIGYSSTSKPPATVYSAADNKWLAKTIGTYNSYISTPTAMDITLDGQRLVVWDIIQPKDANGTRVHFWCRKGSESFQSMITRKPDYTTLFTIPDGPEAMCWAADTKRLLTMVDTNGVGYFTTIRSRNVTYHFAKQAAETSTSSSSHHHVQAWYVVVPVVFLAVLLAATLLVVILFRKTRQSREEEQITQLRAPLNNVDA